MFQVILGLFRSKEYSEKIEQALISRAALPQHRHSSAELDRIRSWLGEVLGLGLTCSNGLGWSDLLRESLGELNVAFPEAGFPKPPLPDTVGIPAFREVAKPSGVELLFSLFLGRRPGLGDSLESRAQQGYEELVRRFLLSSEFETAFIDPLLAGKSPRHARLGAVTRTDRDQVVDLMLGRPQQELLKSIDWGRFAKVVLLSPSVLAAFKDTIAGPKARYVISVLESLAALTASACGRGRSVAINRNGRVLHLTPGDDCLEVTVEISRPVAAAFNFKSDDFGAGQPFSVRLPLSPTTPCLLEGRVIARGGNGSWTLTLRVDWSEAAISAWAQSRQAALSRAEAAAREGQIKQASAILTVLLEDDEGLPEASALQAEILAQAGQLEAALVLAERACEIGPGLEAPTALLCRLKFRLGDGDYASKQLLQLLAGQPPGYASRVVIGGNLLRQGPDADLLEQLRIAMSSGNQAPQFAREAEPKLELGRSLKVVEAALELFSTVEILRALLAFFVLEQQISASDIVASIAAKHRSRIIEAISHLSPEWLASDLCLEVGQYLETNGRDEDAIRFVEGLRDLDDVKALSILANALRRLGRADQASEIFARLISLEPGNWRHFDRLVDIELKAVKQDPLRDRARIVELLSEEMDHKRRSLFLAPTDFAARLDFAKALIRQDLYQEASVVLQQLRHERPGHFGTLWELVRVAQLSGDNESVLSFEADLVEFPFDERVVLALAKAHRAVGQLDESRALLEAHIHHESLQIRREFVRHFFFVGEFETAAREAERWLVAYPQDIELRLLAGAAELECSQVSAAESHVSQADREGGEKLLPLDMPLFRYEVERRVSGPASALSQLDSLFAELGVGPVRLAEGTAPAFDRLKGSGAVDQSDGPFPPATEGPLVSIVMTAYNVESYLLTSALSILNQNYRNLELIVVDDCSTDSTPNLIRQLEAMDGRVQGVFKSTNDGTYVSKNRGLLQARGEFIALQDADDWSHPDRLGKGVSVLLRRPDIVGLTTDWLRMTSDGEIVIKAGGQISHVCCISLMFRRAAMAQVGFFDSVRVAADLEFIQRLGLVYGASSVPRVRWPLLFGRARADSLTASEEYGLLRTRFTGPRQSYHDAAEGFHEQIRQGGSAYMPFPLRTRKFAAHPALLPDRGLGA
jgi:tetratricopeptide (TPR) repeat protein